MTSGQRQSRKPRTTMMEVATRAGVSQATVSLVLNGSPGAKLSDLTKKRVNEAADELGYSLPRRSSRLAPTNQSVIGFIVDELASDPWMAIGFEGGRAKALEHGLHIYLSVSNGDPENEAAIIENLESQPLMGIIYGTILTRRAEPTAALFRNRTVLLNCYDAGRRLHSVVPGDRLGGRIATQHLIDAGRKRIALINGQKGVDGEQERLRGYRQALASNDIPFVADLVRPGNWEPSSGYEQTKYLLAQDTLPDAIFCANDLMALGCYDALKEAGVRIPDEIAVVGFDDREIAQYTHPPLTTLVLPHYEMGATAVETLIEMAGGHNTKPVQIKVECPLVERSSVRSASFY